MLMYNLLEHGDSYIVPSRSLSYYLRHEVNDDTNGNNAANNYRKKNGKTKSSTYFEYKRK